MKVAEVVPLSTAWLALSRCQSIKKIIARSVTFEIFKNTLWIIRP
jgi:hypothetical protein